MRKSRVRAAELRRPWRLVRAVAAAYGAAWRVQRRARLPFDQLLEELREGTPFTGALADPSLHLRVVSRLLPALPPWPMGRCMKRSLVLLHLWSRCGLVPCFHIGVARLGEGLPGHAWLTAEANGNTLRAGSSEGQAEAFAFAPQDDKRRPPAWDDVVCAASRQVASPVCDEIAILGLDPVIYRSPESTAARVWKLVRHPIKVSEIHRTLVHEYHIDEEAARKDLLDVLAQLRDAALIEVRSGVSRQARPS